ncbi:Beta-lactamase superfamily I metal-dependent hydrolase [Limosilactobacillus gastricus PS3]|uniref:Beta-lactamase superfamily I metal-dependent hydrolase n=1 Tax=Limosilactobacillus gastricus PS3 TaxID=1144300 RepID=H4GL18_9LACO|nr:MBL fold metallo-hydrolase [Limosilactobacillus gastricus]EHS84784.1 Beta-lactamase superfamily I metal-dependent hydrolase [Limosilactobacillus gastricus PS3]
MSLEKELKYSILASGSTGNSTYIETGQHRILIDAGLSGKKIEERLQAIGRSMTDIEAIFVTHEHSDHIQGVGVLARRYGVNVYANQGTWDAMSNKIGKVKSEQCFEVQPGQVIDFGDLQVESFAVSHDAAQPQFYQIHHDDKSLCLLTDTGYVSERMVGIIQNADAYLMECNHDTEMLRNGPYTWSLKQRILGDEGHLSNEEGAAALISVIGDRTKEVILGHRSQHNNLRSLAHLTVAEELETHDLGVDHDFKLIDAEPDQALGLTIL